MVSEFSRNQQLPLLVTRRLIAHRTVEVLAAPIGSVCGPLTPIALLWRHVARRPSQLGFIRD